MLKHRNMSVLGLCPDIPLMKKDCAKKRFGVSQQHLNPAFTGFVHRISLYLPFWRSPAPNSIFSGWDLPVCITALFLQCSTSLAPKCRVNNESSEFFFLVKYPVSQAIKCCLYLKLCARVEIVRLDVTWVLCKAHLWLVHSTVTAIYLFKFPICALFRG